VIAAARTDVPEVPRLVDVHIEAQAHRLGDPQEKIGKERPRRTAADNGNPVTVS
jgi:hypothetical protein